MGTDREDRDVPEGTKKAEFLAPSYELKAKAPLRDIDLATAVERANEGLNDLEDDYLKVLNEEYDVLYAACMDVEKTDGGEEAVALLSRMAHEIRGHSGTIGFDAVCKISDSLCSFLRERETLPKRGIAIARLHVDALTVVLRNVDQWKADGSFDSIFSELEKVVHKFNENSAAASENGTPPAS